MAHTSLFLRTAVLDALIGRAHGARAQARANIPPTTRTRIAGHGLGRGPGTAAGLLFPLSRFEFMDSVAQFLRAFSFGSRLLFEWKNKRLAPAHYFTRVFSPRTG